MKARYYLIYGVTLLLFVMSFILFIQASNANIIDNQQSTDLFIEYQSKTKPIAEPKSTYQKYASVSFISRRSNIKSGDVGEGDDLENNPIKKTDCPSGYEKVNGVCIDVTACNNSFPLTSVKKTIGSYVTKDCGSGSRYCYISCQTGWVHSGCNCTAADCSSFPLSTSGNNCNGIKSCKTGDSYKYRCTGCATGYKLTDSGICVEQACSEYGAGYSGSSVVHCKTSDIKRNGEKHCYKCTACEDGWVLGTDFTCSAKPCSDYGAGYGSSQVANCVAHETKKSGDNFCYKCSSCGEGWKLDGSGKCVAKGCSTGYTSTLTANCKTPATEKNGNGYCYKCSACNEGWTLNSSGVCAAKQCSTGYATGMTNVAAPCTNFTSQLAGNDICHACTACSSGYYINTGKCTACTWSSDHTLTSCPSNCNCSSDRVDSACAYKYKITSAQANYYVSGNTCPACTWGGRTLATCPSNCNCSSEACGGSTKYAVTSAQSNHYISGNSCPECTWASDHTLTSCPGGCNCSSNRVNASCSYKYKITSAQSNHYISGSTCPECSWGVATLSSCPTGCNCSSSECGGTTKYYAYSAKQGYTFSNGTCSENACTGYGSTSSSIPYCKQGYENYCQKGPNKVYKCPYCKNGFTTNATTGLCDPNLRIIYSGSTAIGIAVSSNLAVDVRSTTTGYQTYAQAVSTCANKTTGGKSWRVPSKEEFKVINQHADDVKRIAEVVGSNNYYVSYWTTTVAKTNGGRVYYYECDLRNDGRNSYYACMNNSLSTWNNVTKTLCVFSY